MRKRIARYLRRLADWLSPIAVERADTPIEFRTTAELADIIRDRNDLAIIFYGRNRVVRGCRWVDGVLYYRVGDLDHAEEALVFMAEKTLSDSPEGK